MLSCQVNGAIYLTFTEYSSKLPDMKSPSPASLASRITARVIRASGDRIWTYEDFADLKGPTTAVAAALSRLTRKGVLRRLRRGIYYKPEATRFGESRPDPDSAIEATLRLHRTPAIVSGLEAWRRLGLTTQVTSESALTTSKRLRLAPVMGHRVRAAVRSSARRSLGNERAVLDALRAIHRIPGTTPDGVIDWARFHLWEGKLDLASLVRMAMREPPRVRALLGALMEDSKLKNTEDMQEILRSSLNPLTIFKIPGAMNHLKTARGWKIR
jgi:hypothetical protein